MEWEVMGGAIPGAVTGKLEVLEVGPDEAQVGVTMVPRAEVLPQEDEGRRRVDDTLEVTARFFLNRVFWTLEALSQFDSLPQPPRISPLPEDRAHIQEVS
jgi:hypothetical protein